MSAIVNCTYYFQRFHDFLGFVPEYVTNNRYFSNPKPENALDPWHAVKPTYAYACLSIAVKQIQCGKPFG